MLVEAMDEGADESIQKYLAGYVELAFDCGWILAVMISLFDRKRHSQHGPDSTGKEKQDRSAPGKGTDRSCDEQSISEHGMNDARKSAESNRHAASGATNRGTRRNEEPLMQRQSMFMAARAVHCVPSFRFAS
jgi:hypothetical protein